MLKAEYDAYTTALAEYNALVLEKEQLLKMKDILDSETSLSFIDVRYGSREVSINAKLSNIKTDLLASINDEISGINTAITNKLAAMLALGATTSGDPDPAFT